MVVLSFSRIWCATNLVGITPWSDDAADEHRRFWAIIFSGEGFVELDSTNVDLFETFSGKSNQLSPVPAGTVVKALIDDAKIILDRRLHEFAVIVGKAGDAALVVNQFKCAEVSQLEPVYILEPSLETAPTNHVASIQLR